MMLEQPFTGIGLARLGPTHERAGASERPLVQWNQIPIASMLAPNASRYESVFDCVFAVLRSQERTRTDTAPRFVSQPG